MSDPMELNQVVAELVTEVARLVEDLAEMRAAQATEVRTRRLVVVDQDGFERVELSTLPTSGSVTVHGNPGGEVGDERYVRLLVEEGAHAGPTAQLGLYVVTRGESAVDVEVMDDATGAALPMVHLTAIEVGDEGEPRLAAEAYLSEEALHLANDFVVGRPDRTL